LGLGVYCLWRYADEIQRPRFVAVNQVEPAPNLPADELDPAPPPAEDRSAPVANERVERSSGDIPPWVFLTAGLILTSLSLFGRWPLMWITRLLSSSDHE